jgi:hypothetical protein
MLGMKYGEKAVAMGLTSTGAVVEDRGPGASQDVMLVVASDVRCAQSPSRETG